MLDFPLNENDKNIIEKTNFKELHGLTFSGGLPVFTAARTGQPTQGEVWIEFYNSSASLYTYINGTKYKL